MADVPGTGCPNCKRLEKRLAELEARLRQLEAELAKAQKNSGNSSKPPSSDIVKPTSKSCARKKGRKRKQGAQPGHPRHERPPYPPEQIDTAWEYRLNECPCCGGTLVDASGASRCLQQVDLTLEPVIIEEHRQIAQWCKKCQRVHYAGLPEELAKAGLIGPRLTALVGFLKGACHMALTFPISLASSPRLTRTPITSRKNLRIDEKDTHAKQQFQARFWSYLGDEAHSLIWFDFTTTRQRAGPDRVLATYRGYLQADGYGGYDDYEGVAISENNPILKVACWAHARRKFHDALRTEPTSAQIALAYIGQLYALEKSLRKRVQGEWRELPLETRAGLIAAERQACAKPILDKFKTWLDKQVEQALPKSPIYAALRYTLNQWDALCRYVEDGRLAIDNNAAERSLRGVAIGRKNWLFCGSEEGGRTAAVMFTLIASAVRNGLDPWRYLRDVLTRLAALRDSAEGMTRENLLPLLPDRWQPAPLDAAPPAKA